MPPTLNKHAQSRRRFLGSAAVTMLAVRLGIAGSARAEPAKESISSVSAFQRGVLMNDATPAASKSPTVVLVHGAWADGSSWAGVIPVLEAAGVAVVAPANPLRGVSVDAAYLAGVVGRIAGPVLLVGHSYGGVVISNAASQAKNVVGLVYVSAFIPEDGETVLAIANKATDSLLGPALRPAPYPTGAGSKPGTELFVDPASFHAVFCADLPDGQAAIMAATQRPAADVAFGEPTKSPAWKTLPSWAVVGTADKVIGVSGARLMAQRAGAHTTEVDGSHVVMISQPKAVADVILTAVKAVA
jgi:pimeloyl-ACP methyl ester carboxylesterase